MKVYQLHAEGLTNCDWSKQMFSSTVFTTREKAEARIEKFRAMVTDSSRHLDTIVDPKITIMELEVVE